MIARITILLLFCRLCVAEIIPTANRIDWSPGVRGGIPNRTTIFTNMAAGKTAAQIQSALDACPSNQVVLLTNSTFTINATLTIPDGVTLRGAGISNTVLNGAGAFTGDAIINFENGFDSDYTATARALTGCTKGSTNLTTSVDHGWTAGDHVLIDMLEQTVGDPPIDNTGYGGAATWVSRANGNRCFGQSVKILTTPLTTTATIEPPLYYGYNNTPQGVELTGLTHYAGVEDLSVNNLTSACQDTVTVFGAINCWLKNVELKGNYRRAIWGYHALWFEMRGCWVIGSIPIGTDKTAQYTSDRAYGPFIGHFTASLFTDNILEKLTMGFALEGPAAGNVISYNFMTNLWWENTGDSPQRFGVIMHGPHPYMTLLEGNWSGGRLRADEYWGTSSHWTVLRNRFTQIDRGAGDAQSWTIDIERRNRYYSLVGNVIGGGGGILEGIYELIDGESAPYDGPSAIWKIGYQNLGENNVNYDSAVLSTMIRWGNWCYRTNDSTAGSGITWHTENVSDSNDMTIPESYYLASKPSFFNSLTWPPYDPASPTRNSPTNIPAGYRYVYGEDPPSAYQQRGAIKGKARFNGKGTF